MSPLKRFPQVSLLVKQELVDALFHVVQGILDALVASLGRLEIPQQRRLTAKGEDRCVLLDGRFHHGYGQRFDEGRIVLGKFMIGPVGVCQRDRQYRDDADFDPGSA